MAKRTKDTQLLIDTLAGLKALWMQEAPDSGYFDFCQWLENEITNVLDAEDTEEGIQKAFDLYGSRAKKK